MFTGNLSIQVTSTLGLIPIKDATIRISNTGTPENTLEVVQTDSSGLASVPLDTSAFPLLGIRYWL